VFINNRLVFFDEVAQRLRQRQIAIRGHRRIFLKEHAETCRVGLANLATGFRNKKGRFCRSEAEQPPNLVFAQLADIMSKLA
jgi:hypothetical protein